MMLPIMFDRIIAGTVLVNLGELFKFNLRVRKFPFVETACNAIITANILTSGNYAVTSPGQFFWGLTVGW